MRSSIQPLLRILAALLILGAFFRSTNAEATLTVGNSFVYATVEESSGLVTFKKAPVSSNAINLTFSDHSYLSVMIGGRIYTNDPPANTNKPDLLSTTGVSTLVADTIYTTWTNLNGVDLIQKVYPVKFSRSGQIVIDISFRNNSDSTINCAAQYLLDVELNGNDKPKVLTRYSYSEAWKTFPGMTGMPSFYISFESDLGVPPAFNPGLSGQGHLKDSILALIEPDTVTIGDWSYLSSSQWGLYDGGGLYSDLAILFQWPGQQVPSHRTVAVARTSYGTGEYETCIGGLYGMFFYPPSLAFDSAQNQYYPNPFTVDAFVFNTSKTTPATGVSLKLEVGPLLTITAPTDHIYIGGKIEVQDTSGPVLPGGFAAFQWTIAADLYKNCQLDTLTTLMFTSNSSIAPADFSKPSPCTFPLDVPCTLSGSTAAISVDTLPPIIGLHSSSHGSPFSQQFDVHDDRTTDSGLHSISSFFSGSKQSAFSLSITPPLAGSCDKGIHTIKVTQIDSSASGCYHFKFTDCKGNSSFDSLCFVPHVVQGVGGANRNADLRLYPNPTSKLLHVRLENNELHSWIIYDLLGAVVLRNDSPLKSGEAISTAQLHSGSYILHLETSSGPIERRFIVQQK